MGRWIGSVALVALLAACGAGAVTVLGDEPRPLPEPTAEPRSEDLEGEDRVRLWPRSARVEEGVSYRMTAYTHCGLDHSLDFDGSFWEVASGPDEPHAALDDPDDEGVITLVDRDTAVYESSAGAEFELRRTEGPRDIHLCE